MQSNLQCSNIDASSLLKEIFPIPSNKIVTDRFSMTESSNATCKPNCTGLCASVTDVVGDN